MPTELLIIGTHGLAREVAQLARIIDPDSTRWNEISFVAEDQSMLGQQFSHGAVRFTDAMLNVYSGSGDVVIGVGHPNARKAIAEKLSVHPDFKFPNLIHPAVEIDTASILIGSGNIVTKGVVMTCDIDIGNFNLFNWNTTVGHDVSIGSYNVINPGCNISGFVKIADECLIGTGTQVLEHRTITGRTIVGAGSVVTRSLSKEGIYLGAPAKLRTC
jgi:sugar O-acyltransferase (sialic acid O-acetyltransferase NeuD family)